jgi:hypothetical protein
MSAVSVRDRETLSEIERESLVIAGEEEPEDSSMDVT